MLTQSQIIDELNYFDDHRNCKRDNAAPVLTLEDGTTFVLPTRWAVCSVCGGEGHHVNPSIDAGGLSADDFHDDPEFAEDYMSGVYDVTCHRCGGRTTERVVDFDQLSEEHLKLYDAQLQADANYNAERRAEIAFGC